ncbi:MAG: mechanosensitive ion channel domain-containing protein [Pseudomonadota bacterium]
MEKPDVQITKSDILGWLGDTWVEISNPWFAYQLILIAVAYLVAVGLSKLVEPRLEQRVRQIKGRPGLLRFLVAVLRKSHWALFFLLLCAIYAGLQKVTWPSHSYFVGIAARLSLAWLVISVLSKIIRSRSISKVVAVSCWIVVALNILGQTENVMHALDAMAISVGDFRLSMLTVLKGIVMMVSLLWIASTAGRVFDRRINQIEDLTPSIRVLIGKIVRIVLIILALTVALSSIGIDLTALTVLSGAIGVGIGFGLQKVVSNFISGIIILLDKSIKPGDTIALGETFGWIRELRARFISVVTRDGKEFLIPNEDLITQQVVNWSFTDKLIRLDVPFGVSYDSDPHQVIQLSVEACQSVQRVSVVRAPVCWMTEFADSSLNFVLRFWIDDPQNGLTNIRGQVLLALWDTFKENDINIPFPHREIIVKSPHRSTVPEPVIESAPDLKSNS